MCFSYWMISWEFGTDISGFPEDESQWLLVMLVVQVLLWLSSTSCFFCKLLVVLLWLFFHLWCSITKSRAPLSGKGCVWVWKLLALKVGAHYVKRSQGESQVSGYKSVWKQKDEMGLSILQAFTIVSVDLQWKWHRPNITDQMLANIHFKPIQYSSQAWTEFMKCQRSFSSWRHRSFFNTRPKTPTPTNIWLLSSVGMGTIGIRFWVKWLSNTHEYLSVPALACRETCDTCSL